MDQIQRHPYFMEVQNIWLFLTKLVSETRHTPLTHIELIHLGVKGKPKKEKYSQMISNRFHQHGAKKFMLLFNLNAMSDEELKRIDELCKEAQCMQLISGNTFPEESKNQIQLDASWVLTQREPIASANHFPFSDLLSLTKHLITQQITQGYFSQNTQDKNTLTENTLEQQYTYLLQAQYGENPTPQLITEFDSFKQELHYLNNNPQAMNFHANLTAIKIAHTLLAYLTHRIGTVFEKEEMTEEIIRFLQPLTAEFNVAHKKSLAPINKYQVKLSEVNPATIALFVQLVIQTDLDTQISYSIHSKIRRI